MQLVFDTWKAWPRSAKSTDGMADMTVSPMRTYPVVEEQVSAQVNKMVFFGLNQNGWFDTLRSIGQVATTALGIGSLPDVFSAARMDGPGRGPITILPPEPADQSWVPSECDVQGHTETCATQRLGDLRTSKAGPAFLDDTETLGSHVDRTRYTLPFRINTQYWTRSGGTNAGRRHRRGQRPPDSAGGAHRHQRVREDLPLPRPLLRRRAARAGGRCGPALPHGVLAMNRAIRTLFAVAVASTALFAGAWAGGARGDARAASAQAPRVEAAPAYARREAGEIPVGDSLEVSGQPMQLSIFYTADAPAQVALFYARAFQARGVMPVMSNEAGFAHVAGFDRKDGLQHFITAVPQPSGQTLVMLGVANPRRPPQLTRGAQDAGFPVPEENRAYLGYRSSDASGEAESGQFVSSLSPPDVLAFYRRELLANGWTAREGATSAALGVFARGAEVLSVAVQALDSKRGAAVFVNRTGGGAP